MKLITGAHVVLVAADPDDGATPEGAGDGVRGTVPDVRCAEWRWGEVGGPYVPE